MIVVLKDFRQKERNKGGIANKKVPDAGRQGQCLCISKKYIRSHMRMFHENVWLQAWGEPQILKIPHRF